MSTYLITGIAGFIGSNIARALLAQGASVRGVDNFITESEPISKTSTGLILLRARSKTLKPVPESAEVWILYSMRQLLPAFRALLRTPSPPTPTMSPEP